MRAGFSSDWVARVCRVIVSHGEQDIGRFSLEEHILRDADLLDETGALGIVWTAMNAGRAEMPSYADARQRIIEHDLRGVERVLGRMATSAGRTLAENRLAVVNSFIAQLEEELGEKH